MTDFDIRPHMDAVTELVRTASNRSLNWFRQPVASGAETLLVDNKAKPGDFDPVTQADRAVEDEIRAGLASMFPDHSILGEERGVSGEGSLRWIIDPIDGTRAFVSGQPMWGTLVGFQDHDDIIAGWLHQPTTQETYSASPAGAWWDSANGRRPLATSAVTDLSDAVLLCTHPSMFVSPEEVAAFGRVDAVAKMTRYSGDCVNYALLATGTADIVVENQMQPYDIIPLIPIVEGAGGVVTGIDGLPPLDGGWVVAASSPELHQEVLELLND